MSDNIQFLKNEYEAAINTPSDIFQHLPLLNALARQCKHVTEMGVRHGASTRALILTGVTLRSYDIVYEPSVEVLFEKARACGWDVRYIIESTLTCDIEETDMLFIDTDHTEAQLTVELERHGNKARKFLAFHDTETYGGFLLPPLLQWMSRNTHWNVLYHTRANNGFTVLKRRLTS